MYAAFHFIIIVEYTYLSLFTFHYPPSFSRDGNVFNDILIIERYC